MGVLSDDEVREILGLYNKGLRFVLNSVEKGDIDEAMERLQRVRGYGECEICEEGFGELEEELRKCQLDREKCDFDRVKAVIQEWLETFDPEKF